MQEKLAALRRQIDSLDSELVAVLSKRVALSRKVSDVKSSDMPVFRPGREAQLIAGLMQQAPESLHSLIPVVWRAIISSSIAQQRPDFCLAAGADMVDVAAGFAAGQLAVRIKDTAMSVMDDVIALRADIGLVSCAGIKELAADLGPDRQAMVIARLPLGVPGHSAPHGWIIATALPDRTDSDHMVYYNSRTNEIELSSVSSYDRKVDASCLGICTVSAPVSLQDTSL